MGGAVNTQTGQYQQPTSFMGMGGTSTPGTAPTMPGTAAPYIQSSPAYNPHQTAPPPPLPNVSQAKGYSPVGHAKGVSSAQGSQLLPFLPFLLGMQGRGYSGGGAVKEPDERVLRAIELARQIMEGK